MIPHDVVNPNGYVGLNSAVDIGYVARKHKSIYFMKPISVIGVNEFIDDVKTPEEIISIEKHLLKSKYRSPKKQYLRACRTASTS